MEQLSQFYAIYGSLINFIGINALLALSLNVTLAAGMLSLGNAAFAAVGGYTAGILTVHFKAAFILALGGGALMAGSVALVLGLPVLRLKGVFLAMATLAFGEVVRIAAVNLTVTGGAEGLTGIPNVTGTWMIFLSLALAAYFLAILRHSRLGWGLLSIREDETAAACLGIRHDSLASSWPLLSGDDGRFGRRHVCPFELPDHPARLRFFHGRGPDGLQYRRRHADLVLARFGRGPADRPAGNFEGHRRRRRPHPSGRQRPDPAAGDLFLPNGLASLFARSRPAAANAGRAEPV